MKAEVIMEDKVVAPVLITDPVEVSFYAIAHGFDGVRFLIDSTLFDDAVRWDSHYLVDNFQCPDLRLHLLLFASYKGSLSPMEEDANSFTFDYNYIPNDGFSPHRNFNLRVWRQNSEGDGQPIYILTYANPSDRR